MWKWVSILLLVATVCFFPEYVPNENILDKLRDILGEDMLVWFSPTSNDTQNSPGTPVRIITAEELAAHSAENNKKEVWLAILGEVFDVSAGVRHYGAGGGYSGFSGRDATRAFITGDFTEAGLTADMTNTEPSDALGIDGWLKFYHEGYRYLGLLEGVYYHNGKATAALEAHWVRAGVGEKEKSMTEEDHRKYPGCNSRWSAAEGGLVWCSTKSGGIDRSWTGLPRQYYKVGASDPRCACIQSEKLPDPRMKVYPNCGENSEECQTTPPS